MTSKQSYNSRHKAFILINLLFLNATFGSKWVLKKNKSGIHAYTQIPFYLTFESKF